MEPPALTVSAAVREHLWKLCLHEFPCGTGSWVRALAGRLEEGLGALGDEGTDQGPGRGLGAESGAGVVLTPGAEGAASPRSWLVWRSLKGCLRLGVWGAS